MSPPSLFPEFDRLSPILYLHTPPAHDASSNPSAHPELIIVATWMSAPPKLINRYITSYRQLFPSSRILLITSSLSNIFFTTQSVHHALLRPAIPIIQSIRGKVVGAVYSNGGAISLTSLSILYKRTTGTPLPIHALVLDSCPGSGADLASGRRAIIASLPPVFRSGIPRVLMLGILTGVLGVVWPIVGLLRLSNPISNMRKHLLDEGLMMKGGKRTYIASKTDEMVDHNAVLLHAAESQAKGWAVRKELWVGSGHVAHARAEPERYWRVVKETLE